MATPQRQLFTTKPGITPVDQMCQSTWDKLAEDLRSQDRWGDFDRAQSHPNVLNWSEIGNHPDNLIVIGCVSTEHFAEYVPILVQALEELDESAELGMVASALCRKGLTETASLLLNLYHGHEKFEDKRFLWSVGNAIYTIAPRDHLTECLDICRDDRLGSPRHKLIVHLSRFKKSKEVFQTLLTSLDDETVCGAALEAPKRLGDVRAIPAIEKTPVRAGDDGVYESHQKTMALKKLNEKVDNQ